MLALYPRLVAVALLAAASLHAQPSISSGGENQRLLSSTVTPSGSAWNVVLNMDDDNSDGGLPRSFRRWWHCEISNLAPAGDTLLIQVRRAGYTDTILPTWALSTDGGATFGTYSRMPLSATPSTSGSASAGTGVHSFSVTTPPGVTNIRIAKWFPYTVTDKDAFLATLTGAPQVRSITNLGYSWQGRPIEMIEFTDSSVPDVGKKRIWVHSAVHPSENTAYFMVEGLTDFLLGGSDDARAVLAGAIVNVVPMANPDGVFLGNYRTNSRSVNLENQWTAPYNSPEREIQALRSQIEAFMGTPQNPGTNPIQLGLNLHATHGPGFPFHFRHQSNPSFNLSTNRSGVIPAVNALENQWIQNIENESPFIALGNTQNSSCGAPGRPFVECMMHDRWSIDPVWTTTAGQEPVMMITLEGTYGPGPNSTWANPADYIESGRALGRAFRDQFGFEAPDLSASCETFGSNCNSLFLDCDVEIAPPGINTLELTLLAAQSGSIGALLVGSTRTTLPLPQPYLGCNILNFVADVPLPLTGSITLPPPIAIPTDPGFLATLQVLTGRIDPGTGDLLIQLSNGVEVANNF